MTRLVSGREKTVAPGDVSDSRYEFLSLGHAEPNLGQAPEEGYILAYNSTLPGEREWVPSTSGAQGTAGGQGIQGTQGVRFSTFIGPAAPVGAAAGDIWWDSETGVRYVYYTDVDSSQWVQESSPGALGPTGSPGAQGADGTASSQGAQGTFGAQGTIGFSIQGADGTASSQGAQGIIGSQGTFGAQGAIGFSIQGADGTASSQGAQGTFGAQGLIGSSVQGADGSSASSTSITDDTSTNGVRYVLFTNLTSGTLSTAYVSSSKLQYNPSNGAVTATDFSATSDGRLKTILGRIEDPLEKVLLLRGVRYNWNEYAASNGIIDDREQVGVIAQEVEKIFPQAIEHNSVHLSVKYDKLVPLLIEAVKELSTKVEELQKQLSTK